MTILYLVYTFQHLLISVENKMKQKQMLPRETYESIYMYKWILWYLVSKSADFFIKIRLCFYTVECFYFYFASHLFFVFVVRSLHFILQFYMLLHFADTIGEKTGVAQTTAAVLTTTIEKKRIIHAYWTRTKERCVISLSLFFSLSLC